MKKQLALLVIFSLLCMGCSKHPNIQAAYDLIERITPGYGDQFKLELIESTNGQDIYEIAATDNQVILRGNNTISLATAYNQYLKYTCKAHVSWFGDQLNLPEQLPLPEQETRNVINGKHRIYMNYCQLSYSAPWWDWERWQRELDYMAMNSINMPLSVVGLEAVWYNTLLKYKFTDEEARAFLAGPGHLAWQWLQNIQSFGGPLPKSWIDSHAELGKKVINRQLELGMQPIQQGFSGHVPRELKEKFPDAKIQLQPSWCGFEGAAQLDPTDPLFQTLGRDFLEEEKKLFGVHGVYAADPFHESAPPVDTPEYLKAVGDSIHKLFKEFDPSAIWAMQTWSLREKIVKSVPKKDLLLLDLDGEKSSEENCCWGYPIIAGNLHNFGGRINLHGDLRLLASNQYASAVKKSPNVCGSGLCMEGIDQNPVYYDLAFEMPLHAGETNIENWLKQYAERRYGGISENAYKAWLYLLEGPYRPGTNGTELSSIIAARPALNVKKSGPNAGLGIPYSPQLIILAEEFLLKDADKFKNSKPYRFDIVDVQRQLMTNLGQAIHQKAAQAFQDKNKEAFTLHSNRFMELLRDVDMLLRTRTELNFDQWLADARKWGTTNEEKDLFERNATALVTIWGPDEKPLIFDYSWREWSGLIEGFYLKRWEMFYAMLQNCLDKGISYSEAGLPTTHGREAFRANEFYSKLGDWELEYVSTLNKVRTPITQGDEVETVLLLFKKYVSLAKDYYGERVSADVIQEGNTYENLGNLEIEKEL